MEPNAISIAARNLRAYLADRLALSEDNLLIGHPLVAAAIADANPGDQFINLFFFRVAYGGYPPDGSSTEPFYIRIYCLITAFGNNETGDDGTITLSAGENDLRLMGGVMAHLHAEPVLAVQDAQAQTVARLQIVLSPLEISDINNLWSTQADTPYRLSVAYELAMAPIPLAMARDTTKRVAQIGVNAVPEMKQPLLTTQGLEIPARATSVGRVRIDTDQAAWAPHLVLLDADQRPVHALLFEAGAVPAQVALIGLGEKDASVSLVWEQWHAQQGWRAVALTPVPTVTLTGPLFDPADFDPGEAVSVALPTTAPGQLMLHAVRRVVLPGGRELTLRSNPLLVTIFAGNGP